MVSSFFKFISVIVFLAGFAASLWSMFQMFQGEPDQWLTMLVVFGMLGSVISAVVLYALSDFLRCIVDIEANTRSKEKTVPPQP
jgi:hypothetical protein